MSPTQPTTPSPTQELAEFAAALTYADIPDPVREHAELCLLDTVGCALFSTRLPWCEIVTGLVDGRSAHARAVVWGTRVLADAGDAALANATAAHGFELDEVHPAGVHPGPVAWSVALALGEELGSSGADILTAGVAGYEVGTRIGLSVQRAHLKAGFHAMGTIGSFIAAATAAKILGLDREQTRHAIGIVGSFASGLIAAQEGAMTKRLHAGRAAQNGVEAALLAGRGFTGIPDVLENPTGGFCRTTGGGQEELELLTAGVGEVWETANTGFKIHPSCAATHSALDVTQQLRAEHGFAAEDVTRMTVHASSHAVLHSGWRYQPTGITAAQMNYFFVLALMLRHGEVPIEAFSDEGIRDPATLALTDRIEVYADEAVDALGRPGRYGVRVRIQLSDGRALEGAASQRRGNRALPVPAGEVQAKFRRLAETVLEPARVTAVQDAALGLHGLEDAAALTRLLATT